MKKLEEINSSNYEIDKQYIKSQNETIFVLELPIIIKGSKKFYTSKRVRFEINGYFKGKTNVIDDLKIIKFLKEKIIKEILNIKNEKVKLISSKFSRFKIKKIYLLPKEEMHTTQWYCAFRTGDTEYEQYK